MTSPTLITAENLALLTDQYELTMVQAYLRENMRDEATFDLHVRELPENRNYLIAAGLRDALELIETLRFTDDALDYLRTLGPFTDRLLNYLADFRFTGDVRAMPEGTPVFGHETIMEVTAPLPEAQLVETIALNQINVQTALSSKASRIVHAAREKRVVDFGLRRVQGLDAGIKSARAFHISGVHATSNVLAGREYNVPVTGTMAHSYVQAHEDEYAAFRAFAEEFGETILLIDTYDTIEGAHKVCALAREMGDEFKVSGVRLDSGDLDDLSRKVRSILDEAGLDRMRIFASGGLDEEAIDALVRAGAPIDGFGVGTAMGVSEDSPALDSAYKLASYKGEPRVKLSKNKQTLPGKKQVFRVKDRDGVAHHDVIAELGEPLEGEPLLETVMENGRTLPAGRTDLDTARDRSARMVAELPERLRALSTAQPAYEVGISERMQRTLDRVRADLSADQEKIASTS